MDLSTITSESRLQSRRQIGSHLENGRVESAIADAEQAVADWCVSDSPNSVECISALVDLAGAVFDSGEVHRALWQYEQARQATLNLFGQDHPDSIYSMLCLANCHLERGQIDQSESCIRDGLQEIDRLQFHRTVLHARFLAKLSTIYLAQDKPEMAKSAAIEALVIRRRHEHELWNYGLQCLSEAYCALGQTKLAESVNRKQLQKVGYWQDEHDFPEPHSIAYAEAIRLSGDIHRRRGNLDQAQQYYGKALTIALKTRSLKNTYVQIIEERLRSVEC